MKKKVTVTHWELMQIMDRVFEQRKTSVVGHHENYIAGQFAHKLMVEVEKRGIDLRKPLTHFVDPVTADYVYIGTPLP